jgi:Reverse transcriptase (RNA-dependent DNA polymerase)
LSPTIFNVVIDAIVCELLSYPHFYSLKVQFYADDGLLASTNPLMLQTAISVLKELFLSMGLTINASKTKILLGQPAQPYHSMSTQAYNRRITGEGQTYRERMQVIVECPICYTEMQKASLPQHLMSIHNEYNRPER